MIETWFNSVARIEAMEQAAREWVGTPFVANSRAKGPRGGTCCHMLAEQLYIEAGYPLNLSAPDASMRWSDTHRDSLIECFLNERSDIFAALRYGDQKSEVRSHLTSDLRPPTSDLSQLTSDLRPPTSEIPISGDIIGFRIGGCVHHVGVVLPGGRFIHCMRGIGTKICNLSDPTYSRRIEKIWRPRP
jgi:cell wall-associated NlpC family hydrolase